VNRHAATNPKPNERRTIMRAKITVRYYLIVAILLAFLFFSNDFGLTDVQKTALVIAVGIDREESEFIVTSQIALPKSEKDGENAQSAQIVSKGKTVSEAFEQINAKTGWYPKLVFCQLIILGESATKKNVFECLNFFLRDEYLSDGCLLAACDGSAQELLNAKNPVEELSGLAASKVLSPHSERVGTVLPNTLREFSASYYAEGKSGYLPILKAEPPQEKSTENKKPKGQGRAESNSSENQGQASGDKKTKENSEEKVFSASETALFLDGVQVGKLTQEESKTFAFVKSKLRLATYLVKKGEVEYALNVKRNTPKIKLSLKEKSEPSLDISITVTAGILDGAKAQSVENLSDAGEIPSGVLSNAEEKLQTSLVALFEKTRSLHCDIFDCVETLKRKEYDEYHAQKSTLLERIHPNVTIRFENVR
jgi:Ger(x)C family germination protein